VARAIWFVGGLACGVLLTASLLVSHADEADAEVQQAAVLAHVDPTELEGALNSLKTAGLSDTDPYSYLRSEGKLPPIALSGPPRPPVTAVSPAPAPPVVSVWTRLAQCESNGDWRANTGNGFSGGLQFTASTWRAYGGVGSPASASRDQQIAVAQRVLAGQGWRAWPNCSRMLGLR